MLDLLFVICDIDNAEQIMDELVAHLVVAVASILLQMGYACFWQNVGG